MAGRYEFGDFIASGGMAEVWRARDNDYGREVAVKLLKPEYADDPASRARFEAEARHVQSLEHPNVAAVYDVGEMPTASGLIRPYLTMEYVAGRPLSALIADGPLPAERVQSLLAQAGDGLAAAHSAGIVHRDVKPANLIVTDDGTLKITDFGIARSASQGAVTVTGQVVGTPQYLSPEQARGEIATPASDVYGLGVVAYEALTGSRPFDRPTAVATALAHLEDPVPALPESVPPSLAEVVRQSLAKDPADRPANGAAFAEALRAADLAPAAAPDLVPALAGATAATDEVPTTVVTSVTDKAAHAEVATQAIEAIDLPLAVARPAPTDFVPSTQVPVEKKVDPLAPQRSTPAERPDAPTHARTTVVRLPKPIQPLADRVNRKAGKWPFGTLDTVLVVLAALAILAMGWVVYFLNAKPPAPSQSTPAAAATYASPHATATANKPAALVDMQCGPVRAGGLYLKGRTLDGVKTILTDIGVKVQAIGEAAKHDPINTVSRVTPCRGVHQGDTVQVYYWSDNPTSGATP